MPPEFVQRQVVTKKFDIYSLGVIAIELMTGTRLGFLDMNLHHISSMQFIEEVSWSFVTLT
jgi:serine/threonine protein kinase